MALTSKNLFKLFDTVDGDGSAGGGSTPAEPVQPQEPAPAAPVEDSSTDSGVNWDELSDDVDDIGDVDGLPAEPNTPADPTSPTPAVDDQAAEPPVTPEDQPVEPAPVDPEQPPQTPEQIQAAEAAYMAQLERLYQFNEDTALLLQTEPEKVLPALAAKLHMDVMRTVLAQVQGVMPQVIQQQTKAAEREESAKSMFFSAWPELKGYDQQVLEVGKLVRTLNPNADAQKVIQLIGETAMKSLGLTRATPAPQDQPPTQQAQMGFRPAVPGRVSAAPAAKSEWDDLLDDD